MPRRSSKPTLSVVSLGCPKNQVDAECMARSFMGSGCIYTSDPLSSDLVLIFTCGFIEAARTESVDTILQYLQLKKERPELRVIVGGCLFERYRQDLAKELPEVDGWLDSPSPQAVRELVQRLGFEPGRPRRDGLANGRPFLLNEPGMAYLNVSEGCDRPCSFCAIPAIKGPMRSRPIAELAAEARDLATRLRVQELNLVAQDPASYGKDLGNGNELLDLLTALGEVEEVAWMRLLYMFPFGLREEHLDYLASNPRFVPYLDMPLQHSHREVLQRMCRPGDGGRYLRHLETIRERWPGVAVRTTFLVGHPGETEAHFRSLCDFVREARFQWVGVFEYSPEEGTPAFLQQAQVSSKVAARRAERLRELAAECRDLTPFRLGQAQQALVVELDEGLAACRTAQMAPEVDGYVYVTASPDVGPGRLTRLILEEETGFDFRGRLAAGGTASVSTRGPGVVPDKAVGMLRTTGGETLGRA
ncbi:MAG: 30S ribosomal protein S12 methylthiotransferase RimO [Candidatus Riflebacteria bacterium]|nr:30S ribosomal protein S12 methylthiotransferase RimO [Candidatus Riflebacteria bacterium]